MRNLLAKVGLISIAIALPSSLLATPQEFQARAGEIVLVSIAPNGKTSIKTKQAHQDSNICVAMLQNSSSPKIMTIVASWELWELNVPQIAEKYSVMAPGEIFSANGHATTGHCPVSIRWSSIGG